MRAYLSYGMLRLGEPRAVAFALDLAEEKVLVSHHE